jgi:hypothetical protein
MDSLQRQEGKWWLPIPELPVNGLSEMLRKLVHNQRNATSQILKAAMASNTQVLSEMEILHICLNSLPKMIIITGFIHQPCMVMSLIGHMVLFYFREVMGCLCLVKIF